MLLPCNDSKYCIVFVIGLATVSESLNTMGRSCLSQISMNHLGVNFAVAVEKLPRHVVYSRELIKRHKLRHIELPEAGRKREFVPCFSVPNGGRNKGAFSDWSYSQRAVSQFDGF